MEPYVLFHLFIPIAVHADALLLVASGTPVPWWTGTISVGVSSFWYLAQLLYPIDSPVLALQQITELKKENFNLKLRIYFLEERMQQEFAGPTEHIYKTVSSHFWLLSLVSLTRFSQKTFDWYLFLELALTTAVIQFALIWGNNTMLEQPSEKWGIWY